MDQQPLEGRNKDETTLYKNPAEALKKVSSEFEYWSGKLTETSLQMSYALIAANWIVFGSLNGILASTWAKVSLLMVIVGLAVNVIGAWRLSESLRNRVGYGEADSERWAAEFKKAMGKRVPWPFTESIESTGKWMRRIKAISVLVAGLLLIIGATINAWH